MLQRFGEKVQQANMSKMLIDGLSTPHIDKVHPNKVRRVGPIPFPINNSFQPESADLPNPANRLDASGFQDIGPLNCNNCNAEYHFTAGEQAFYKSKGFEEMPKKCKSCRTAAKASSPDTSGKGWNTAAPSTSTSSTSGGWGSAAAPPPPSPNAKDLWTSSGRTWPPNPKDLPKGATKKL